MCPDRCRQPSLCYTQVPGTCCAAMQLCFAMQQFLWWQPSQQAVFSMYTALHNQELESVCLPGGHTWQGTPDRCTPPKPARTQHEVGGGKQGSSYISVLQAMAVCSPSPVWSSSAAKLGANFGHYTRLPYDRAFGFCQTHQSLLGSYPLIAICSHLGEQ